MSYDSTILGTTGLVSYYRLNETSGTSVVDSKGTNTGTYTGGITLNQSGITGVSAQFDGVDDYINFPTFTGLSASSYSYEAWINIPVSGSVADATIMSTGTMGILNRVSVFSLFNPTTLYEWRWSNDVKWTIPDVRDGQWHHLVFTWDGTTRRAYFDTLACSVSSGSAASASLTFSGVGTQTPAFSIAAQLGNNGNAFTNFFPAMSGTIKTGKLAEVAYYNTALSPATIISHFNAAYTGPGIARISQLYSEFVIRGIPTPRVTQVVGELLIRGTPTVRTTQINSELLVRGTPTVRTTQLSGELLQSLSIIEVTLEKEINESFTFTESTRIWRSITVGIDEDLLFTDLFQFVFVTHEHPFEILTFTENISRNVIYNRTISETLLLRETAHQKNPRKSVSEVLIFVEMSRFYKPYDGFTNEQLEFIESVNIAKINRGGIVEGIEFIETLSYHLVNRHPILEENLIFIEIAKLKKTYYRAISEIIIFSEAPPIRTDFGIPDISLPVIVRENYFVTFEANGVKITLPRPILGDVVSDVDEVKINRAMHGKRYTYVRSSNRQNLKYHFYLPYAKAIELQNFVQAYSSIPILHIDWKGAGWYCKFINNPIERTTSRRSVSEISRVDVDVEIEGFKLWG